MLRADPRAVVRVCVATGSRPESGSGLKQFGFSRFRVVNGDPAQFLSVQTRGIDAVTQFVYPRAEAAHIVFEAQFAEAFQCSGGEHVRPGGWTGPFVVRRRGCRFRVRRAAVRLSLRLDRRRRSGPENCSCHYPVALSSVSITPGTRGPRVPSDRPFQPAIAGVYI